MVRFSSTVPAYCLSFMSSSVVPKLGSVAGVCVVVSRGSVSLRVVCVSVLSGAFIRTRLALLWLFDVFVWLFSALTMLLGRV